MKNDDFVVVTVYYYQIPKNVDAERIYKVCQKLPSEIRLKAESFRFENDKICYLIGKLMLNRVLEDHARDIRNLKFNEFGKPFIDNFLDFSTSHSEDRIVFCFSSEGKVGIDIEKITKIHIENFESILTRNELNYIDSQKDKSRHFLNIWTKKEAVLKAMGTGLCDDIVLLETLNPLVIFKEEIWFFKEIDIFPDCIISLGLSKRNIQIKIYRFNPFCLKIKC
jgi:4'-phosphopantetheinyl transferase